jgi:hypothetical protein
MVDQVSDIPKSLGIISVLEKAHETRTSLLLFAFVMFLDSAMVVSSGRGLYDLYANPDTLRMNLALDFILIFVFFSLFMSIAMPLTAELVRQILILCFHSIWFKLTYDAERIPSLWRAGYVRPYRISKEAHSTKDEYFLELEKEAKEKEREAEEQRLRLNFLSISCFVLSMYNLLYGRASHANLLQHIGQAIPDDGILLILLLPIVFLALATWLTLGEHDVYIYCPSLAQEYVDEIEKNNEIRRKLRDRPYDPMY